MPGEGARNKSDGVLSRQRPRVCLIAATPLTLQFFFRDHVASLHRWADVTLIFNHSLDKLVQPIDLPADHQSPFNATSTRCLTCCVFALQNALDGQIRSCYYPCSKAGLLGSLAGARWCESARSHFPRRSMGFKTRAKS